MATELKELETTNNTSVGVTSFRGGVRGQCVQLNQSLQHVQLTFDQVQELRAVLAEWTVDHRSSTYVDPRDMSKNAEPQPEGGTFTVFR